MSNHFVSFNQKSKFERMSSFSSSSLCFAAFLLCSFIIDGGLAAPKKHVGGGNSFNENRVRGGGDAPAGTFDFLPYLFRPQTYKQKLLWASCSSTIISPRHILTAAHCVTWTENIKSSVPEKFGNITGDGHRLEWTSHAILTDVRPKEKIYAENTSDALLSQYGVATRLIFHPSFRPFEHAHDIAIIEYPNGTNFEIDPIILAGDYKEKDGDMAIAAGYGIYKFEGVHGIAPDVLQNASVHIWLQEQCAVFEGETPLPQFICTGEKELRALQGDSGGPLIIERDGTLYQIGVTSWGIQDNTFYARISNYCDWITKVTNQEVHCKSLPLPPDATKPTQAPSPSSSPDSKKKTPTAAPQKAQTTTTSSSNMVEFNALLILFTFMFFAVL